jgi:hypothetical protein
MFRIPAGAGCGPGGQNGGGGRCDRALRRALRRPPRCSAPSTRAGRSFWGLAGATLVVSILYPSQLFMLSLPSHK